MISSDCTVIVCFAHVDDAEKVWFKHFHVPANTEIVPFVNNLAHEYLSNLADADYYAEETACNYNVMTILPGFIEPKFIADEENQDFMSYERSFNKFNL